MGAPVPSGALGGPYGHRSTDGDEKREGRPPSRARPALLKGGHEKRRAIALRPPGDVLDSPVGYFCRGSA